MNAQENEKYELIHKDGEIGSTSIVASSDSIEDLLEKAKELVSNDNMDNALTEDEAVLQYTSYLVEFVNGTDLVNATPYNNVVYSGKNNRGVNTMIVVKKGKAEEVALDSKHNFRLFIGRNIIDTKRVDGKTVNEYNIYYAKNLGRNNKLITDLGDSSLNGKSCYYIRNTMVMPLEAN